jgi:hypothetical protein
MWRGTCRRGGAAGAALEAAGHSLRRIGRSAAVAMGCGLLAASCSTSTPQILAGGGPRGTTVAFESIDGPPEAVFHKLVAQLTAEANARRVAVVSREEAAQYRVRGYVAAHVKGKRTTIAWVWDIYDSGEEHAMRLSGEVSPASPDRKAWAAADDEAIARMARDGMDRLAAFLAAPGAAPPDEPPPSPEPSTRVAASPAAGTAAASFAYLPPARQR